VALERLSSRGELDTGKARGDCESSHRDRFNPSPSKAAKWGVQRSNGGQQYALACPHRQPLQEGGNSLYSKDLTWCDQAQQSDGPKGGCQARVTVVYRRSSRPRRATGRRLLATSRSEHMHAMAGTVTSASSAAARMGSTALAVAPALCCWCIGLLI